VNHRPFFASDSDRRPGEWKELLHYRQNSIHGNPFLRLLRREVEALVTEAHGSDYLRDRQAKTELARINRELKGLKTQIAALEERRSELLAELGK